MKNRFLLKISAAGAGIGTAIIAAVSPEMLLSLVQHLSAACQTQFAKNCFMFSLAAYIHSGRMKKEVRTNFESLSNSINNFASAFKEDLKEHRERMDTIESRVARVEGLSKTEKLDEPTVPVE